MRIMSLNTWGGRLLEPLCSFLLSPAGHADIYCLQEVCRVVSPRRPPRLFMHYEGWPEGIVCTDLLERIEATLPHHDRYFASFGRLELYYTGRHTNDRYDGLEFGIAMFVRKELAVERSLQGFIHNAFRLCPSDPGGRTAQVLRLRTVSGYLTIANIHGVWGGKDSPGETPERAVQLSRFERLVTEVAKSGDRVVLCGDFNLPLQSPYLHYLEMQFKLVNLIERHSYVDTQSGQSPSTGQWRNVDHMLVSPALTDEYFDVLWEPVVSDHRPLILDIPD